MARCQKTGTKQELLDAGMKIMQEKGYTNSGLQQVLDAVGVPKGSFYHYFDSKEDFALQIIDHYDCTYTDDVMSCLQDQSYSPLQRLQNYCLAGRENIASGKCTRGCLIGNLSQEMASQSEALRTKLDEVFIRWSQLFAVAIEEGQKSGEIDARFAPLELAELFLSAWEGALLRAKSTRSTLPIDNFIKLLFVFMAGQNRPSTIASEQSQHSPAVVAYDIDQVLGRPLPRV